MFVVQIPREENRGHLNLNAKTLKLSGHADHGVGSGRGGMSRAPVGSFLGAFTFRPHQMKAACDVAFPGLSECYCVRIAGKTDYGENEHVVPFPFVTLNVLPGILVSVPGFIGPCPLGRQFVVHRPGIGGK